MTTEESIVNLTTQTTNLLDTVGDISSTLDGRIETAVTASQNAALIPLVTVATNLIDTQTIFINYITQ